MKSLSLIKILNLLIIIYFGVFSLGFNINLTLASQVPSSQPTSPTSNPNPNPSANSSNSATDSPDGSTGSESGLVKCGVSRDCTICDIFILVRDIFNFALGLLAALAVVSIVIGGVYIVTSAGDSGRAREGYSIITNAVIGLLLVMASFLFFSFALVSLGFQSANFSAVLDFQSGQIFSVKCDNTSTFNDNGQNGGGLGTLSGEGGGSGNVGSLNIACIDSKNINDEISAVLRTISLYEGTSTRKGYFTLQGNYSYPENTLNHPDVVRSSSTAYGRYQMLTPTWRGWAARAGVPKSGSDYNISPVYQDATVARFLSDENIANCQSFASSAGKYGQYGKACQWTSIPGCRTQPNDITRKYPDANAVCNKLLEDEKTGNCK